MQQSLPETMNAVVCRNPNEYVLEVIPTPKAGENELIIKVSACGICAGDVKAFHGADMFWSGEKPWIQTPVVPGHEFYGEVVQIGEGMKKKWKIDLGDRIIAEQIVPCGECRFCRSGQYWMCEVHNMYGFQHEIAEGGMAEYMKFGETSLIHRIPESMDMKEAALIEPMACAIHTVQRATIELDDVVVLAGAGPLGLCMVQIIKLKTPKKCIVLDMDDDRLALAKELGADLVINPAKEDAEAIVRSLTDGYGCDVYIEATGHPAGVKQGLSMTRKLGRFVEFSVFGQETTVDWSVIGDRKELDIRGSHLGPYCYPIAIDLFERGLASAQKIVTHTYPLSAFDEAMDMASRTESIKVVLIP
jgi:erythritol/L-threitol dehydrogenase